MPNHLSFWLFLLVGHIDEVGLGRFFNNSLESLTHSYILLRWGLNIGQIHGLRKGQNLICRNDRIKIAFAPHEVHLALDVEFVDFVDPMR